MSTSSRNTPLVVSFLGCITSLLILLIACGGFRERLVRPERGSQIPENRSGIFGAVMSESDVSSSPHVPLQQALVLAIRDDKLPELRSIAGSQISLSSLQRVPLTLTEAQLRDLVADYQEVQDGEYHLAVPAGTYLVCLGNVAHENVNWRPVQVAGCVVTEVNENSFAEQTIMYGEGGVMPQ